MSQERAQGESYYTDEDVIGSTYTYHRPTCPAVRAIYRHNRKRLQNWQVAVALGLTPCGICKPFYAKLELKSPRKIGF